MRKNIMILLLLISSILLTGCGATEEDLENAKNPLEFVQNGFVSYYKKEINLIKSEEKVDEKEQKTTLMRFQLKEDENLEFDACSYWAISSPIPKSYYTYVNNYENTYAAKFVQNHFEDIPYVEVTLDPFTTKYNEFCELNHNKIILELKDISKLDNLEQELIKIKEEKEIYAINLKIKYEDENVTLLIFNQSTEESILEELNKLKKS